MLTEYLLHKAQRVESRTNVEAPVHFLARTLGVVTLLTPSPEEHELERLRLGPMPFPLGPPNPNPPRFSDVAVVASVNIDINIHRRAPR